jgi:hypothetical protein
MGKYLFCEENYHVRILYAPHGEVGGSGGIRTHIVSLSVTDLQSACFSHLHTLPYLLFSRSSLSSSDCDSHSWLVETMGFEPITARCLGLFSPLIFSLKTFTGMFLSTRMSFFYYIPIFW